MAESSESSLAQLHRMALAAELVALRTAAGQTQAEAEHGAGITPRTLVRYEQSRSSMTDQTAHALLDHYGVTGERRGALLHLVTESRRRRGRPRPAAPAWFDRYWYLEQVASHLTVYAPAIIPGLLQTRDYAEAVLAAGGGDPAPLARTRLDRQRLLDDGLHLDAVIHESALHSRVGGPAVMADQLDHLIEATGRANITLRILPLQAGATAVMGTQFAILDYAPIEYALVYLERPDDAAYLHTPDRVELYRRAYRDLTVQALDPTSTTQVLVRTKRTQHDSNSSSEQGLR